MNTMSAWAKAVLGALVALNVGSCSILFDSDAGRPNSLDSGLDAAAADVSLADAPADISLADAPADVSPDDAPADVSPDDAAADVSLDDATEVGADSAEDAGDEVSADVDPPDADDCGPWSRSFDGLCHLQSLRSGPTGVVLGGACGTEGDEVPAIVLLDGCDGHTVDMWTDPAYPGATFTDAVAGAEGRYVGVGAVAFVPLIDIFTASGEMMPVVLSDASLSNSALSSVVVDGAGRSWVTGVHWTPVNDPRWLWMVVDGSGEVASSWTQDVDSRGTSVQVDAAGETVFTAGWQGEGMTAFVHPASCAQGAAGACKTGYTQLAFIPPPTDTTTRGYAMLRNVAGDPWLAGGSIDDGQEAFPVVGSFDVRVEPANVQLATEPGRVTAMVALDQGAVLLGGYTITDGAGHAALWRMGEPDVLGAITPWAPLSGGGVVAMARHGDAVLLLQTTVFGSTVRRCTLDGVCL